MENNRMSVSELVSQIESGLKKNLPPSTDLIDKTRLQHQFDTYLSKFENDPKFQNSSEKPPIHQKSIFKTFKDNQFVNQCKDRPGFMHNFSSSVNQKKTNVTSRNSKYCFDKLNDIIAQKFPEIMTDKPLSSVERGNPVIIPSRKKKITYTPLPGDWSKRANKYDSKVIFHL